MPEPTRRPSLLEQKQLDKTYGQRMDTIHRGDPNLKPDLIDVEVVKEPYDEVVKRDLLRLKEWTEGLITFIEESSPEKLQDILDGVKIPSVDFLKSIKISELQDYDFYFQVVMSISEKIDQLLDKELSDGNKKKLEELQELLMDALG